MTQNEMQALLGPINRLLDHAKAGTVMPAITKPETFIELLQVVADTILPEDNEQDGTINGGQDSIPILNGKSGLAMGASMRRGRTPQPTRKQLAEARLAMSERMAQQR